MFVILARAIQKYVEGEGFNGGQAIRWPEVGAKCMKTGSAKISDPNARHAIA